MGVVTGRCPPPDELDRLLAEQLGGPEYDAVEAHVESCLACQAWLDRRVGTPPALAAPRAGGRHEDATPEPDAGFLDRLERLQPPGPRPGVVGPPPAGDWLENGRLGQYEVIGKLGQGGMGAVYKARHVELGKLVALKVLPTEHLHEASLARFKREVRAFGRLEHPNVVAAHDAGQHRGVHYLAMSLVDGVDLARLLAGHGPLRVADACEVARQAAAGLQHAADHGLVHRDVKPSNLMLARDGLVKLLDLGLARSAGDAPAEQLTAAGMLLGTADYLAPEQWHRPHAVDSRADIYGLGCTLYHLLAGRPPFAGEPGDTVLAKMHGHLEVPPPPVSRHRPDVPAGLATVLGRMLAKDPADRFATPADAAAALGPFAAGADLAALLRAAEAGGAAAPAAAAVTPGQSLWDTRPDPAGRARREAPRAGRPRRTATVALAGLVLGLLTASFPWWPGRRGEPVPGGGAPKIKGMQVTCYRDRGKTLVGDLQSTPAAVRLNDDVRVTAELSAPAYCYLIAFNPDGKDQLCYPTGENGTGAPDARPERCAAVRYPADDQVFVLDEPGMQVFVLAASARPLPPFAEWKGRAGAIPWKAVAVPEGEPCGWRFDGREFARFQQERGQIQARDDVPPPLRELCQFFKRRAEFDAVQVIAFPVLADRK
jgi:hypothetical protein